MIIRNISFLAMLALFPLQAALANYSEREDVQQFIDQMVQKHDFDRGFLHRQFSRAEKLEDVLEKIAKPAEKTLNWKQYQRIFLTEKRVDRGRAFIRQHAELLARAEREFGVPAEIIAAIIGVETYYGRQSGRTAVFDSLTTLGFDYPPRSKFFRSELEQLLLLSREEDIDVKSVKGSYAGAMGMPQFISSSYRAYAVDFDKDGKRDLWHSMADVIGSVANYFSEHGWRKGESILHQVKVKQKLDPKDNKLKPDRTIAQLSKQGVSSIPGDLPADAKATLLTFEGKRGIENWIGMDNFYVITRYNHSSLYAMAVYHLSRELKADSTGYATNHS